jgi:hypothetical protein
VTVESSPPFFAQSFRASPGLDVATVVTELERGEALVSTLDDRGAPVPVRRTLVRPPESRVGPLEPNERAELIGRSPVSGRYDRAIDRESAHEKLLERARQTEASKPVKAETSSSPPRAQVRGRESAGEAFVKSAARAVGSSLGRQIMRGLLGSLMKR